MDKAKIGPEYAPVCFKKIFTESAAILNAPGCWLVPTPVADVDSFFRIGAVIGLTFPDTGGAAEGGLGSLASQLARMRKRPPHARHEWQPCRTEDGSKGT